MEKKVYGMWLGDTWARKDDGGIIHSEYHNLIAAQVGIWNAEEPGNPMSRGRFKTAEVKEIGEDGKPVC